MQRHSAAINQPLIFPKNAISVAPSAAGVLTSQSFGVVGILGGQEERRDQRIIPPRGGLCETGLRPQPLRQRCPHVADFHPRSLRQIRPSRLQRQRPRHTSGNFLRGTTSCLAERCRYHARVALRNDGKCQPCRRANALRRARCRTSLFDRPMTMMLFERVVRPLGRAAPRGGW